MAKGKTKDIASIGIGFRTNTKYLTEGLNKAKSIVGSFANGLATAGLAINGFQSIASGLMSVLSKPLSGAMEYEKLTATFEVLTGSAEQAQKTMEDLRKFGAESVFDMPELANSGKKLLAFKVSADELTPTLKMLGELAAGLEIPLNELSDIYGKNKISNLIQAEDLNQLQGRGINVTDEFAKQFGLTGENAGAQVRKMASEGKIQFKHLEQAFKSLTTGSGQFAGMMDKQAKTMSSIYDRTMDAITNKATKFGTFLIDAFNLKDALNFFSDFLDSSDSYFDGWMASVKTTVDELTPIFQQLGNVVIARFNSIVETGTWVWNSISSLWQSTGMPTFTQMKDFIFDALVVSEFAFTNFWSILKLGATQGLLSLVTFSADVQHQFTTVIPGYLEWFGNNFQEVIGWALNEAIGRFSSFFSNLISMFSNLPGLIAGTTDWDQVWQPFQATALQSVVDLPEIPDRVKGEFEKELAISVADQSNKLTESLGDLLNKRRTELLPDQKVNAIAQAAVPKAPESSTTASNPKADSDVKLLTAATWGSKEANDKIAKAQMRAIGGTTSSKDPVKIQQEQLQIAKREEARQKRMERYMQKMAGEASGNIEISLA